MKHINIECPQGYEIDKEQSTFERIVFKEIKKGLPKKWEELEKIDRALEEKKSEKKGDKKESTTIIKTQQITSNTSTSIGKVAAVAKKAEELNLLIQRFTY